MTTSPTDTDPALRLLRALATEDGQSLPRLRKRLRLSMSELLRLLVELGAHPQLGGLDLVTRRTVGGRDCLFLTPQGRALCDVAASDDTGIAPTTTGRPG